MKGMHSSDLIIPVLIVILLMTLICGCCGMCRDQRNLNNLLEHPEAVGLEFKEREIKGKVELTTEYHSGPRVILVSFLQDGTFAMSFESIQGTVISEHGSRRWICGSDIDSIIENSWSLELKSNEYITCIVQEVMLEQDPYVCIRIKTNLTKEDSKENTFENRQRKDSDLNKLTRTVFSCPPGFMISSFECIDNQITSVMALPVVMIFHSTVALGQSWKNNLCRSKKFMLTSLIEFAIVVLDIVSLCTLFAAFGENGRGTLGYLATGQVQPIENCILQWNNVVKPCLAQGRDDCLTARIKVGTEITFRDFAEVEGTMDAGGCFTSTGMEIACSACRPKGNQTNMCTLKNIVIMYPYRRMADEKPKRGTSLNTYSLSTWNIESDHQYCVTEATHSDIRDSIYVLAIWKVMHIVMEISLFIHELNDHKGATNKAISSFHLENVKTSKLTTLIKSKGRSILGFFVSTPANYMYASLLTVGAPITASSTIGVEKFKGPGMWAAGSTLFMSMSSFTIWMFCILIVFYITAIEVLPVCCVTCVGKGCSREVTRIAYVFQRTHLNVLRYHNKCMIRMVKSVLKAMVLLIVVPLIYFFVLALQDSISDSAITFGSILSAFNLKLGVNISAPVFDVVGVTVLTASATFTAAIGRYIVMVLHIQPKSVSRFCLYVGRTLSSRKTRFIQNGTNALELVEAKGVDILVNSQSNTTTVSSKSGIALPGTDNNEFGHIFMGEREGKVVIRDKAGEFRDKHLERSDTEGLVEDAADRGLKRWCDSPVYTVFLTPPKVYQLGPGIQYI